MCTLHECMWCRYAVVRSGDNRPIGLATAVGHWESHSVNTDIGRIILLTNFLQLTLPVCRAIFAFIYWLTIDLNQSRYRLHCSVFLSRIQASHAYYFKIPKNIFILISSYVQVCNGLYKCEIHPPTHSPTHPPTHPPTYSLTTQIRIHAHIRVHTLICTHSNTHSHIYTLTYTHTRTHAHTYTHTYIYTQLHKHADTAVCILYKKIYE